MHLATTLRREPEPKRASPAKVRVSAARRKPPMRCSMRLLSQQRELLGAAFEPMIHAYFRGMEQNMTSMRSALAAGERHELRGHAHKAKSSSLQVGGVAGGVLSEARVPACLEDEPLASLGMRIDELERRYQATERLLSTHTDDLLSPARQLSRVSRPARRRTQWSARHGRRSLARALADRLLDGDLPGTTRAIRSFGTARTRAWCCCPRAPTSAARSGRCCAADGTCVTVTTSPR